MKKMWSFLYLFFVCAGVFAQEVRVEPVGKTIGELGVEHDLSTPLNAYLTMNHLLANGKDCQLRGVCTQRNHAYLPSVDAPDKQVGEQQRRAVSGRQVVEVRHYGDSVAAVIVNLEGSSYVFGWTTLEGDKWVNAGEGLGNGIDAARRQADENAGVMVNLTRRIAVLQNYPADPAPFADYLKGNAKPPKEYMLEKLASHRLLICGEIHRRCISWNLLKELVNDPRFAEVAGVVFVELPSWKQDKLDEFFAARTMNPELILDVMRAEQVYGWWDGGEYEFLLEVWKVNKKLPKAKKIRVVAADWQTPWGRLQSKEDVEEYHKTDKDRNGHMADVIESYLNTTSDRRSGIFTVGFAHAFRSQIPGMASSAHGKEAEPTAGTQLTARLSAEKVFILFPHVKITDNGSLEDASLLRNGIFDKAFARNGNVPVAFDLAGSPFGREPFDAAAESRFDFREGSYEDNFDGYVFFGPLADEGKECHVYDIFTDEFISEIKRRAVIFGWEKEHFFGMPVMELTKEAIIRRLKAE